MKVQVLETFLSSSPLGHEQDSIIYNVIRIRCCMHMKLKNSRWFILSPVSQYEGVINAITIPSNNIRFIINGMQG